MDALIEDIKLLITDATNYLKLFVSIITGALVLGHCVMYMIASEEHLKSASLRKVKTTIVAGIAVFVSVQLVNWVLGYFK